ncbi:MAG: ATP-binding protein [Thermicanus sp.]|nr:ATP-binding protein [Thermicanus sp.]
MALVEPFLLRVGGNMLRLEEMKTALSEACLNAIEHGNLCDPSISYEVELLDEEQRVIIRVYDQGNGAWQEGGLPRSIHHMIEEDGETRGWGLPLIDRLSDEWELYMGFPHYIEMRFYK